MEDTEEFMQAAKELGYEIVDDLQDLKTSHAFEVWEFSLYSLDGIDDADRTKALGQVDQPKDGTTK